MFTFNGRTSRHYAILPLLYTCMFQKIPGLCRGRDIPSKRTGVIIDTFKTESKCCAKIIQLEANVLDSGLCDSVRLKSASAFDEGAPALNGTGAARTATGVRKETASRRDGMINIWRNLSGLSERRMGWRPAWRSYWSRCHFIPQTGVI